MPFPPAAHDFARSGSHHLLASTDGHVYLDRDGKLERIPGITGVLNLAW